MKNLTEMLSMVVQQQAGRTAVVEDHTAISYLELEQRVLCLAGQLWNQGVRPGNGVAIFVPNGIEFITSFFAIVRLGGIVVPLNDHYQQSELTRLLNEAAFSFVVTSKRSAHLYDQILQPAVRSCRLIYFEDCPWTSESPIAPSLAAEIYPDAPVMHQFSSGSTGTPKRISRTHRNLLYELDRLVQTLSLGPEDRFLGVTPFSHVNGLMRSMMASLRAGATLVPMARFERQAVAEMIEKHRISVFIGVPFMFGVLAKTNYKRTPDFSSLRLCLSASAPMPPTISRQFHEKFGIYVRQLYGSTETGTISVNLTPDIENSLDSVGTPIDGVEVEIFTDDSLSAQQGETGEIAVKSAAAIQSYDGENELSQSSFRNGYFFTGDVGWKDHDGRLYLTGRKKFFINKGGYKINPREIEDLLQSHPKVEEAVVIGVPTVYGDNKLKAIITLNESCSEEELAAYCGGRIARFKVPSVIEFVQELPKSATGKVRRALLVEGQEPAPARA